MDGRALFETNLGVIERAIARVCLDTGLRGADAEDFGSTVKLALLVDDCAILRKFEGRSSLATYLTIVVRRMLTDQRRSEGRWYASAEAQRRGDAAVALERLLHRDQRSLGEAIEMTGALYPAMSRNELESIAASLPERAPRPKLVAIIEGDDERFAAATAADDVDLRQRSERTSHVVRNALASMSAEDRVVLRLRFGKGASVADIARALGMQQRPLYRRIEALLGSVKRSLARAGIDEAAVADLIGAAGEHLHFDLRNGKTGATHPSMAKESSSSGPGAQT